MNIHSFIRNSESQRAFPVFDLKNLLAQIAAVNDPFTIDGEIEYGIRFHLRAFNLFESVSIVFIDSLISCKPIIVFQVLDDIVDVNSFKLALSEHEIGGLLRKSMDSAKE